MLKLIPALKDILKILKNSALYRKNHFFKIFVVNGFYDLQTSTYENKAYYKQRNGQNYIYWQSGYGNWHLFQRLGSAYADMFAYKAKNEQI